MTKSADFARSAGELAVAAAASRALANCASSRSQAVTEWPCLTRCLSMASPIRPTPTMPTRSLPALALVIRTSVFLRSALGSASRSLLSLCLGLEHGGQRLGRIGEIGGIDRHAALDQPAR